MDQIARLLILSGIGIAVIGVLVLVAARLGVGRLPGDIAFERGAVRIYVPIVASIVLSIILTVVLNVALRFWR